MCGITGFWVRPQDAREELCGHISSMNEALRHRGPDDGGTWVDEQVGIGLANRRLAILDLSASGHQPILSSCGRFVIAYNGEVYNFESIREALRHEGKTFRSHTDTEAIVEGCAAWGLKKALEQMNGMFAFALWDRKDRTLSLVRDRLGVKPLYYGRFGTTLLFGSELKALVAHPAFRKEIDRDSLALFFRHGYIPSPYTIYKGVRKLPPGHTITLSSASDSLESAPYWSAKSIGEGDTGIGQLSDDEAITQLDTLLRDAVRLQMVSDVPLGAFLSGGIDSSTVVALMQVQSARRIRTFSIGFVEKGYNEADYASAVAKHLGTDHSELYVSPEQILETVNVLPEMYDEPLADTSQIPTYLLSSLTRKHVTVSLSGDGGDELFGGYDHYPQLQRRWKMLRTVPQPVRALGARAVSSLLLFTDALRQEEDYNVWNKLRNVPGILESRSPELLSRHCLSHWRVPSAVVANSREPATLFTDEKQWPKTSDSLRRMMYLDLVTYLPDDVLTKLDRASMAVSLEARVPLLDHRVVEFAMQVPSKLKFRNEQGKWLLRQVLQRYVPTKLFDRPKMGFSLPIGAWLRGTLRPWAEQLLDEQLKTNHDLLDSQLIRRKWADHTNGNQNWGQQLWNVLMFQAWCRRWL
jgi:asparagine synthase (glutamine-hydrolysing)